MSRFVNDHERAFELACMAFAESIAESDRQWLDQHLTDCAECATRKANAGSELKQAHANSWYRKRRMCFQSRLRGDVPILGFKSKLLRYVQNLVEFEADSCPGHLRHLILNREVEIIRTVVQPL